ncbi:MAG TPA: transketolase [Aggregatilineaceae bacterium]|nr:transketolase [Aggregatilineaceae bacterium]
MADFDQKCINTIRMLAVDGVQQANSGHPGLPMGAAPMAYVLWTRFLKHNPTDPQWINRDRFILSAGHGSMLLYALLHLTGYDLPLEQLKRFRQWGSITPGHPEYHVTPGVETTTGPLGQGFTNGVGMAIAEAHLAATFNQPGSPVIDHYTYAIVSDGDLMEGITSEAASIAGHLKLGKLIYLYDNNHISIEGNTQIAFTEDVGQRFEAYGWHVTRVEDGNDLEAIDQAIRAAQAETARPSLIMVRTTIGYGSPNKANTPEVHGSPLGDDEVTKTKQNLGWPLEPKFYIPDDVLPHFRQAVGRGQAQQADWQQCWNQWAGANPDQAALWDQRFSGELPAGWDAKLPVFNPADKPVATRVASGKVMNAIAPNLPSLMGGSADLEPSTKTYLNGFDWFESDNYKAHNLHFGVREHAMGGIANGMAVHGGLIPYTATFLVFSDYMRGSIRLAALSSFPTIFVFTHDSIGIGEDGPTHEPVEHVMSLRLIPSLEVIRPADANETAAAWRCAIQNRDRATVLCFTRQNVPILDPAAGIAEGVDRGAYVLSGVTNPQVLLIGTGSEVHIALAAQKLLADQGIAASVISMPSWERFARQPQSYRDSVLPPTVAARVAIEAGVTTGWQKWVGQSGIVIGIDRYGASAPYQEIYQQYGLTPENMAAQALSLLK